MTIAWTHASKDRDCVCCGERVQEGEAVVLLDGEFYCPPCGDPEYVADQELDERVERDLARAEDEFAGVSP